MTLILPCVYECHTLGVLSRRCEQDVQRCLRCLLSADNENSIELVEADGLVDSAWKQGRPPKPRLAAFVHKMGQRGE